MMTPPLDSVELTESELEVLSTMCELCREAQDCKLTWSDILSEISKRRTRQGRKSMSKATLTQVLNKLINCGLVEKQVEVKGVKLKIYYKPTERGCQVLREKVTSYVNSKLRELVDLLLSIMSSDEVRKLISELVDYYIRERIEMERASVSAS